MKKYDFSGYATKNDLKCSDGRTIQKDAFIHNDGDTVPLVWNHRHDDPNEILGHALLENRADGVYAYCSFNDTESGEAAKKIVQHGDVVALSIFANQLKQNGATVVHGAIREVSLVLAGANPGAFIDAVMVHGEDSEEEAIIYTGENIVLFHSDDSAECEETKKENEMPNENKPNETEKTVKDVVNSMTEEQKNVMYALIAQAVEDNEGSDDEDDSETAHSDNLEEGDSTMKHNLFDNDDQNAANTLSHSDLVNIVNDAKRNGSLRDAFMAHCDDDSALSHSVTDANGNAVTYGIANIDYLFPDARTTSNTPDLITRDMGWVQSVMGGAKHIPFSRVKSVHANITQDEARAKGFIKGNQKANEVFALLKRVTNPTTVYHKTKLDRDDVVDITDFDVISWIKHNERLLLDEEIARAALIGDGRVAGTDDKISEDCIRPIWTDNSLYTIRKAVTVSANATDDDKAKAFIRAAVKARKDYKGSGNPVCFTTEDVLTDCLLLEDGNGRVIYETVDKLKTALRVKDILTVPPMEGLSREGTGTDAGYDFGLLAILVNMSDYGFGADKGGAVNMFDDFDIDFNQMKYLIETRCSGALQKPYSAIAIELKTQQAAG